MEENNEPQAIELKAVYSPDGKLSINCPLMSNPLMMKGFIELVKEGVNSILSGQGQKDEKIQPAKGSIINFARKRFNA
jgi:hypothetical protein